MAPGQKGIMTTEEMTAALEAAQASIAKLEKKNSELIDREKTAKTTADLATAAAEEAEEAREEAAREAAAKSGDVEKLKASLETKHAKALKTLQDQVTALTAENTTFKVDSVITKALIDGNVSKGMIKPLEAMLKAEALTTGLSGDDLSAHVAATLKSDDAKAWISAPVNIGTGSTGVQANTGIIKRPETQDEMVAFANLSASDPVTAQVLAKSWGMEL